MTAEDVPVPTEKTHGSGKAESDRLISVGKLAGGIAHEITNPLNAIVMNAELALLLLQRGGDRDRVEEILRSIVAEAKRGGALAQRLSALARTQRFAPGAPANLNDAVGLGRRLLGSLPRQAEVQVELVLAPELPDIPLEPTALALAVAMLIEDRMRAGAARVCVSTASHGAELAVEVTGDTERALECAHDEIMALRLAEQIVRDHGGTMDARGATVRLTLPAATSR